jgi:D-alanyl-D-alanine carboxypeptidase (penicillin-binding protein 5/6)
VTSALRDGMRLISVVMGSTSMKARENASASLLGYGFTFYDTKLAVKGGTVLATARVWKGQKDSVDLGIKDDLYVTVPRGQADGIKTATDVQPRIIAPVSLDRTLGSVQVFAGNQTLATLPLHPVKEVPAGGWWRRLIDTIRLWFARSG